MSEQKLQELLLIVTEWIEANPRTSGLCLGIFLFVVVTASVVSGGNER